GSARASVTAAFSLSTTGFGVALGAQSPIPERRVESGQSGLVRGWNCGRRRKTVPRCHRESLDSACAQQGLKVGRWFDHEVDLPRNQILCRRAVAAIGHKLKAGSRFPLKRNAGEMPGSADTSDADGYRVGMRPQIGDQFAQTVRRQTLLAD